MKRDAAKTFPAKGKGVSRRAFVKGLSLFGTALGVSSVLLPPAGRRGEAQAADPNTPSPQPTPKGWYTTAPDGSVSCAICPHNCRLANNATGLCRTHINRNGDLYTTAWGNPCVLEPAPIEIHPLYHVYPSTKAMNLATGGCMLRCPYCARWDIAQNAPTDVRMLGADWAPAKIVEYALKAHDHVPSLKGVPVRTLAFSCTEPVAFYEYMCETAKAAKSTPLKTAMVSSAYINAGPLKAVLPYIDACGFALKGFTDEFYKSFCSATLAPVLDALKLVKAAKKWLEIHTVIVPGRNDDPNDIQKMCNWIVANLGADTPLHFMSFKPTPRLPNTQPPPLALLAICRRIGLRAGLTYVYIHGVGPHPGNHTWCPNCRACLITRADGKCTGMDLLKNGKCKKCGAKVPGLWSKR